MASGSQNLTTYIAKHIIGDSTNVNWAGALLHNGAGGKTSAMDTWIFADDYGSASSTYGLLHRQDDDKFVFVGGSADRFWNDLNTGDTYVAGKLGINYNPETSGNTYQLYVNGMTNFSDTIFFHKDGSLQIFTQTNSQDYSGGNTENVCIQTSFDNQDYTYQHFSGNLNRVNLLLQPKGGQVYIGLDLTNLGNTNYKLYVNGNTYFNGNTISSGAITCSSSVNCKQILMDTTTSSASTSQPTALSYGRLQAYGTLCINADTDGSTSEYCIITSGRGCSSSISDGIYVGYSEFGSYLKTCLRNCVHIRPGGGNWDEGIRIHAASNGWTTLCLCGTDNTGDTGTSANTYSMHVYGGNFYLTRNGSSSGSSMLYCLTDNYWRVSTRLYNAVWNDFAEYRRGETTEGGRAVYDDNTGIMKIATERMQPASRLVSDTYGFAVGESDDAHTPIGVGGRVLAFTYQDRNNYKVGDAVCAAPNGTVDIMTREEIKEYPDRIIGIVSEIPDYEVWENKLTRGGAAAKVPVNGRIWVYIK